MTETDSVRLARVEEKLDALIDRLDERCGHRDVLISDLRRDVDGLKQDRAKILGGAAVGGGVLGFLGSLVLKIVGVKVG